MTTTNNPFDTFVPEGAREEVKRDTLSLTVWEDTTSCRAAIGFARHGTTESYAALTVHGDNNQPVTVVRARVQGEIVDALYIHPWAPTETNVLAIAARVATDPPGAERWSFFVAPGNAPMFALSTGADVTIETSTMEHTGPFPHPFVVHGGPNAGGYDWNGTTFVRAE